MLQNTQRQQQNGDDDDGRGCREYGYVDETPSSSSAAADVGGGGVARRRRTVICGDGRRDKLVLQSDSNVVHVVLNRPTTNITNFNFLLHSYGQPRSYVYCACTTALLNITLIRKIVHSVEI